MDLLTQSLQVAGAVPAAPYASRMLSTDYKMECPPVGRQFQVWTLPDRPAQNPGEHDWLPRARLGEDADGSLAQKATSQRAPPPADRKASVRKVIEFLRSRGQVGYTPTISTEAQSGYSVMARRSHEVLFDSCGGDGSIPVHFEGT